MLSTEGTVVEILPGKASDSVAAEVLRNLDSYMGLLAESQRLDLDDQLNIEFTRHDMEGASSD